MIKIISLISAILTLLLVIIIAFSNMFFAKANYLLLFWPIRGSLTLLILLMFILGIIFGLSIYAFFASSPLINDDVAPEDTSDWK